MQAQVADPIDTRHLHSLSFRPSVRANPLGMEEAVVAAQSDTEEAVDQAFERAPRAFPLRPAKIQRPHLPGETLRRERLLNWLDAQAHRRVVFVVAEAGFGKTTLLADFAGRTRRRTFWYRLDEDDTDGLVFLRYLVAACRAVDPRLAQRCTSLLAESASGPADQEEVLETFIAELEASGAVPSTLVLDDYHAIEGVPSIREVMERLISRAPACLSFVLASRRTPDLAVGALRARDELAELGREELRFEKAETDRLFRDSYRQPLESDVLSDLQSRTEGWAASLQLVRTAVGGRTPDAVRSFVRSLSGAEGSLYEYLAEEVVGDLDPKLREFLIRASILEDAEPETAAAAAGVPPGRARQLLGEAQRLGLMACGGDGQTWRPHPLVREYLLSRLVAEIGEDGLADLHRRLAVLLEPRSWRLAARHWASAGEAEQVRRVICQAAPTIIATGDLPAAEEFIARFPDPNPNPWFDLLRARSLLAAGRHKEGLELTRAAGAMLTGQSPDRGLSDVHALAAMSFGLELNDPQMRRAGTSRLAQSPDPELAMIARASEALCSAAEDGSLDEAARLLTDLLQLNRERGHAHYEAITLLNTCGVERQHGNPARAAEAGRAAISLLRSGGYTPDLATAQVNLAMALADLGQWQEAVDLVRSTDSSTQWTDPRDLANMAELHAIYGDPAESPRLASKAMGGTPQDAAEPSCLCAAARVAFVRGQPKRALALVQQADGPSFIPGVRSSRLLLAAQIRAFENPLETELRAAIDEALSLAEDQQAWFPWKTLSLTQALVSDSSGLSRHVASLTATEDRAHLSISAELVVRRLGDMDDIAFAMVASEAASRPERWRWTTRHLLADPAARDVDIRRAAEILDAIGTEEDVALLRSLAHRKALGIPDVGRGLIRRLAPRAFVDDLGRLEIQIGDRVVASSEIRRKVLSLLCFLLTRPKSTSSREQVIEALWPEMDPDQGANSLNQTVYFLRRVFEPACEDDTTAGYVQSRGDLIWLDPELVQSRSSGCARLVAAMRRDPSPELAVELAESYAGRFAVDFLYEDWSSSYRDTLHAAYLDRIEKAIERDTARGAFDRAISVAQHAIAADPEAEQIELALLRLYRLTGAHAAAAEQYAHYAAVLREQLGVEPPPLESL
jgi:ATP/maltotriose-dependent transcriptional regulator MalT/DNA-binding SARP family transcriptional activator